MPAIALVVMLLALLAPAPAAAWTWPVEGPVIDRFAYGPDPFARGQHRGIDLGAPPGTRVHAACPGRVRFAGTAGRSGRTVSLVCGPLTATYLHLATVAARPGSRVDEGGAIGTVGATGAVRRPHLHFGLRRTGRRWAYVDPLHLLPRRTGDPPAIPAVRTSRRPHAGGRAREPWPLAMPAPRAVPAAGPEPRPIRRRAPSTGRSPHPSPGAAGSPAGAPALQGAPVSGATAGRARPDTGLPLGNLWVPGGGAAALVAAAAPLLRRRGRARAVRDRAREAVSAHA